MSKVGSGSSTGTPNLGCLANRRCKACVDALTPGSRNRRRNPSLLIQHQGVNILIDCGKTFRESWVEMIEKHSVKDIHAIIISHAHADAFLGLDDVREVIGHNNKEPVTVYATEKDLAVIQTTFPYLVDKRKATGSGYVSSLLFKCEIYLLIVVVFVFDTFVQGNSFVWTIYCRWSQIPRHPATTRERLNVFRLSIWSSRLHVRRFAPPGESFGVSHHTSCFANPDYRRPSNQRH
jgi:ribonuclease BN (tRNA processing enzyme)